MNQELTVVGMGTPETWDQLVSELEGKKVLEKPRVSKKTLTKAIRMQARAIRHMSSEMSEFLQKFSDVEKEFLTMKQLNISLQEQNVKLEKSIHEANAAIDVLQENAAVNAKKIERMARIEGIAKVGVLGLRRSKLIERF